MKELVVVSGKGGTGKTSVVAAFATLAERKLLVDCDVNAADLHLVLDPRIRYWEDFCGGRRARIMPKFCTGCGKCQDLCQFGAVLQDGRGDCGKEGSYWIDPVACKGCGVCVWFCPQKAIAFEDAENGKWFISDTRYGPMVHARLSVAEEDSGKLVSLVREQSRRIARAQGLDLVIIDGPSGIGCPVIASMTGADLVLVVTDPTSVGAYDFGRIAELITHFGIPTVVCINKWDLNAQMTDFIEAEAQRRDIHVVGRIRYDSAVTRAQVMKASVVEYTAGAVTQDIRGLWRHIVYSLG